MFYADSAVEHSTAVRTRWLINFHCFWFLLCVWGVECLVMWCFCSSHASQYCIYMQKEISQCSAVWSCFWCDVNQPTSQHSYFKPPSMEIKNWTSSLQNVFIIEQMYLSHHDSTNDMLLNKWSCFYVSKWGIDFQDITAHMNKSCVCFYKLRKFTEMLTWH